MNKFLIIIIMMAGIAAQAQVNEMIIARNTGKFPLWNGDTIAVFGFTKLLKEEVNIPGPTLHFKEGDQVVLDLWNVSQGAPHTIHLHGLDVDQANDGVPHLSFDVGHMKHGFYNFIAPHAGTYLYHCHVVSAIHVQAGMYGLIIIHPADGSNTTWSGGYTFDTEKSWLMSEVDTNWHKPGFLDHPHDTAMPMMKIYLPTYMPQHFLINGRSEHQLTDTSVAIKASKNETVYLRLANVGYYGNAVHFPAAMQARIVASDGRPLPQTEVSDSIRILPGERYGVLLKANQNITDSIAVQYFDLNTGRVKNTQYTPVDVQGTFSLKVETQAFHIYPNPADNRLNVFLESKELPEWYCTDIMGREIPLQFKKSGENEYFADVSLLSAGAYILKIKNSDSILSETFFKQ